MEDLKGKKRLRDSPEAEDSDADSQEVKRLRENLLGDLEEEVEGGDDNGGVGNESCEASLDLDSVMKSFEMEIAACPPSEDAGVAVEFSESAESRSDLGYLLEASDDDLGLPPSTSSSAAAESFELGGECWGFEAEMPDYLEYEYGLMRPGSFDGGDGEYVEIGDLFDYSDMVFGADDLIWRPENMPAQ